MALWQFITSVALAALCLLFAILVAVTAQSNRTLEAEFRQQQQFINQGALTQQRLQGILIDMARVSVENTKMREVLARHGYQVNQSEVSSER